MSVNIDRGSNPIAFAVPNRSTVASCTEYNAYRYGLDEPYQYLKALGRDAIRTRYLQREVVTLLGSKDNNTKSTNLVYNCNTMTPLPQVPSTSMYVRACVCFLRISKF